MRYFVSWSGGKDSCLALHVAAQKFGKPHLLLNVLTESGLRSRSHGLLPDIIKAQAQALGITPQFFATTWQDYEERYYAELKRLRDEGFSHGVFGDINIRTDPAWSEHRQWADKLCASANIEAVQPLWDFDEETLVTQFLSSGIHAIIVAVNARVLPERFLGQTLNANTIDELVRSGAHSMGERGEYHTVVTNGPLFENAVTLRQKGVHLRDGYWFLDLETEAPEKSVTP